MAYVNIRGKKWIQLFIFLPFIIPSYITTLAWVQFLGKNGPIQAIFDLFSFEAPNLNLYSMEGIIFMLGISHFPLVYLLSVSYLSKNTKRITGRR